MVAASKAQGQDPRRRPSDILAEVTYVFGVLAMVLLVQLATEGFQDWSRIGSIEATFAAAFALFLLSPLAGFRLIRKGAASSGSKGAAMAVAGASIMFLALVPSLWVAHDVSVRLALQKAYTDGYFAATEVGMLAAERPEDAKDIGLLFGLELFHEGVKDLRDEETRLWDQKDIDERRKKLGLEKDREPADRLDTDDGRF